MYQSPLKTEVDVAKVLLKDGWRPIEINGVLQFPLSEEMYQKLGAASLFFLISDDFLAEDVRPGAKKAAMKTLLRLGWIEAEVEALLKPDRAFSPQHYQDFQDYPAQQILHPTKQTVVRPRHHSPQKRRFRSNKITSSPKKQPLLSPTISRHRRSMGINRLLGLLLILIALVLFVFTL